MTEDRVLTTAEAAVLLRLSPTTLKKQARDGAIPGRKAGKKWRFSEQKLWQYLRGENGASKS